jgi:hypothetical protein
MQGVEIGPLETFVAYWLPPVPLSLQSFHIFKPSRPISTMGPKGTMLDEY